jgi:hypothetical protein
MNICLLIRPHSKLEPDLIDFTGFFKGYLLGLLIKRGPNKKTESRFAKVTVLYGMLKTPDADDLLPKV